MRRLKFLACCAVVVVGSLAAHSQSRGPSSTVIYEGGRLIAGDGSTVESGAFVVRDGRITALGRNGAVSDLASHHWPAGLGRDLLPWRQRVEHDGRTH